MSSFRKYNPGSFNKAASGKKQLLGTKAWLYGQSLISTGCSDLNNASGTGIPVSSVTILSEDNYIRQGRVFEKLFIAEGINSKQKVFFISSNGKEEIMDFLNKLPAKRVKQSTTTEVKKTELKTTQPRTSAWQYGKYLSQHSNQAEQIEFCHTFDLSQNETDKSLLDNIQFLSLSNAGEMTEDEILTTILSNVHTFITYCKQNDIVGRVVLDISSALCDNESLQNNLFSRLRILVRQSTSVLFVLVDSEINGTTAQKYGDCLINLQPWQGITPPDEFSDTVGLLHMVRLPSLLSLYSHNKSIFIYGIKRSMHSIHLSELRIPPLGCKEFTGNNDLF